MRRVLEQRLSTLDRQVAAAAEEPSTDAEPTDPVDTQDRQPEPATETAEGGAPIGPIIMVAAGGAALLGGVLTGIVVSGQQAELDENCPGGRCGPEHWDEVDSAQQLALVTDILPIGGGSLVAVGVVWWLLSGGDEDNTVQGACTSGGCSVSYEGRF